MDCYRAVVQYDGTDFYGFQIQAQGRTVQGEIEKSLKQITQANIRIKSAGRTDTGVHALGQVIAFTASWQHSRADFERALNAVLPDDIVIEKLQPTDDTFHPRFDAVSRSYRYTVINRPWPNVLERRYTHHITDRLDAAVMNEAAQWLIGSHDFSSFGQPPQGQITIRQLTQAEWTEQPPHLFFNVTANAFLYRMVRRIVGTLIEVGLGRLAPDKVGEILAAHDLRRSAPPAPACGLCLMQVSYME